MASIIKKKVKKYTYYYLVESARVNGNPRIVNQKYLGSAADIAAAVDRSRGGEVPDPEYSIVLDYGAVCALYDLAERLGVRETINECAGKRNQGIPVGDSVLLASINRAVNPKSKNSFYAWLDKTVLHNMFPAANKKTLSSQGFWNNMSILDSNKITEIEDRLTKKVVDKYGISTECLLFDNTNFFTYMDTANPSELSKRGNSKQKRNDLKIIGLSMMLSPDDNIPLFHEAYPGNKNDAKRFSEVIDSLKKRYMQIKKDGPEITLVFDKGNNNESNIEGLLEETPCAFHYVGGLRLSQCPDLLEIPRDKFTALVGESFQGATSYRTNKRMYNREATVVVTYNPQLFEAQLEGVLRDIEKCVGKLQELRANLDAWAEGAITKGKKPNIASVAKKITAILSAQHMMEIFKFDVSSYKDGSSPSFSFYIDEGRLNDIKDKVLGKSILFTDHLDWADEKIVATYRSQYHIEDCFRQMKDTKHLSFRPVFHWTDKMIRVHVFYCVLSLMLCNVLNKEIKAIGHKMSVNAMIETLAEVQQVITVFPRAGNKQTSKSSFSRLDGIAKKIIESYDLTKYKVRL